jgi:hypothetical protein
MAEESVGSTARKQEIMSWSFHFVGKAIDVNAAIHAEGKKDTNANTQKEINSAIPHIIALLEMNQSEAASSGEGPDEFLVSVRANGSAWWEGDTRKSSSCYVEIKRLEGTNV